MRAPIKAFLSPPVFKDEERTETAKILNSLILYLLAALVIAGAIGIPFFYSAKLLSFLSILPMLVSLGLSWLFMRLGKVRTASHFLVVVMWLIFSSLSCLTGGIYSANLVYLLSISVIAGLLNGILWTSIAAFASFLLVLALAILEALGIRAPQPFPAPPLSRFLEFSYGLVMALIPLSLSIRSRQSALLEARQDLAARLHSEQALRRSEERFRAIYDSLNEAVFLQNQSGLIRDVNQKMTQMYGWSRAEVLESPFMANFCSQQDGYGPREMLAFLERSLRGEVPCFEYLARHHDGHFFWVEITMSRAEISGEAMVLVSARLIDERIRLRLERAQLETQLRQSQRMESIGRLAGGLAHDFNNILTAILGNLELALLEDLPEPLLSYLREARQAGQRATDLTRQLLTFSQKQLIEPKVWELSAIIQGLRSFFQRLLGPTIRLVVDCPSNIGLVRADRPQIEHAIMNLVVNARDAMPDGGELRIELDSVSLSEGQDKEALPGPYLRLAVIDQGIGISPDIMPNIFEPFFTTKANGKGTGLGLAMVFGAISQAQGFVRVSSQPGKGSRFEIYLPMLVGEYAACPDEATSSDIAHGSERLILVEDERLVRDTSYSILKMAGYDVKAFASGEDVLRALPELEGIDLLITDVILPDLDGVTVAERCRASLPGLKVLFISGYPEDIVASHGVKRSDLEFLAKPYSPQSLSAKVRLILSHQV